MRTGENSPEISTYQALFSQKKKKKMSNIKNVLLFFNFVRSIYTKR